MESVENSKSSLHYRRAIIIKDEFSMTLWIIFGSGVSKKTKTNAEKLVEKINNENNSEFTIKRPEYDDATDIIDSILDQEIDPVKPEKSPNSKASSKSIPMTPKVPKVDSKTPRPKGDDNISGPEIKEFQIAYYEDSSSSGETSSDQMKEVLVLISKYIEEVDSIMKTRPSKKSANTILNKLSKDILELIY